MDINDILFEIRRTLFFNKVSVNENLTKEEKKIEILKLLNKYLVKNYLDNDFSNTKRMMDEYVLNNSSKIKSVFNKYLANMKEQERTSISTNQRFDCKLAKMINDKGIRITFMNIEKNIKLKGFSMKKTSHSYIVSYREKELSTAEKRYIIACELVNIMIQDLLPPRYQFKDKRVISFTNLNNCSQKYYSLIKSIVVDYYVPEENIKQLLNREPLNQNIIKLLCETYKMPREIIEERIDKSRLRGKIKQLEGR